MSKALPFRRMLLRVVALSLVTLIVASCGANLGTQLPDPNAVDLRAKNPGPVRRPQTSEPSTGRGTYEVFPGQPQQPRGLGGGPGVQKTGDKYTINVDAAEVGQVAKLILGDTLGYSYVVDPRVQGTITLSTGRPLAEDEVLSALEAALRMNGAVLIKSEGYYKVVPLQEVLEGEMGTADLGAPGSTTPGYGVSVVPLRNISASSMLELLDSFIARSGSVRASNSGNLLLIRGAAEERQSLVDVVLSFDVDWMRSQSASIAILANSTPGEMVGKLEAIFAQDAVLSGSNAMRVIPLERLNGVLLISSSQEKVRRALGWVGRLDRASTTDTNYYVYAVQNGNAIDLARILNATFLEKSGEETLIGQVDPTEEATQVSTPDPQQPDSTGDPTNQTTAGKEDRQDGSVTAQTPTDTSVERTVKSDLSSGIRITPNPANNTIVIRATPSVYRKILKTLRQIDSQAVQVLINTTIAEVSLNDNLRYGVQAYFKGGGVGGGVFNGNALKLLPSFPGLNFFIGGAGDPEVMIDALSKVTSVRIVSSPSIVVMENETATIKVGDQVPIQTGEVSADDDRVTSTFEYRDTGVILKVKPRINADGLVTMVIGQELSSVTSGATTTLPTISQRTVNSTVSVYSTQTVVLGGLISGQDNRDKEGVPLVNQIPVIGDLIGRTDNKARRSELIVFITPQIIQSGKDASSISEELRSKMKLFEWN